MYQQYNHALFIACARQLSSEFHMDHFVYAPSQWETTVHCNVRRRWIVTSSPIGWAYTQNDLCFQQSFDCDPTNNFSVIMFRFMSGSRCLCARKMLNLLWHESGAKKSNINAYPWLTFFCLNQETSNRCDLYVLPDILCWMLIVISQKFAEYFRGNILTNLITIKPLI